MLHRRSGVVAVCSLVRWVVVAASMNAPPGRHARCFIVHVLKEIILLAREGKLWKAMDRVESFDRYQAMAELGTLISKDFSSTPWRTVGMSPKRFDNLDQR